MLQKLESKRAERPSGCTFTPTITKAASRTTTPKDGTPNRFERLFSDGAKIKNKKDQIRESTATQVCWQFGF